MTAHDSFGEVYAAVLAALADASPERALERVLESFAARGVRNVALDGAAWLRVQVERTTIAVDADDEVRSDALAGLVQSALTAALRRAHEAQDRERLRERFDMLSAASFEGILVHVDSVVIDANQRIYELLRCEERDVLGESALRWIVPEDRPGVVQRLRERSEGAYVIGGLRKDGSLFRAELSTKQGKLGDQPVRIVAVRDVTERERIHEELREGEESLRELLTAAFDVFVVSHDNVVVEIGGRVEALIGRSAREIIGKDVFEFLAPSVHESTRQLLGEGRRGAYESALLRVDGQRIPIEICGVFARRLGKRARVSGLRDLRPLQELEAERQKLQQQLERSQRLESLGVLAGGIAHDFNNLLVAILGNADLLYSTLTDDGDKQCALVIRKAGERAAELIRQMLAYAGQRGPMRQEPVDLTLQLRELSQLLSATLSKKAELELLLEPGCVVFGDSASLSQVLMNLLTNASDALGDQPGKVSLSARSVEAPDARWEDALGATIHPGKWVLVEVSDTGAGMDEATRVRVFEPFFTTKPRGHGLGLAACLGIVTSHGGAILVESRLGQGSRFSVLLPAADRVRAERAETPSGRSLHAGRVLVVDDEQVVRAHLRRALTLRGYSVSEADSGAKGIAALSQDAFDVVLLDLTMSDMDGLEVIRRVRQSGSRVPIVLSSGYLDAESERALEPHSIQAFLRKPYLVSDLLAALERARATDAPGQHDA